MREAKGSLQLFFNNLIYGQTHPDKLFFVRVGRKKCLLRTSLNPVRRVATNKIKLSWEHSFFLIFFLECPIWLPVFFLFFNNEPELGAEINPGMALAPFPSSNLDETRFEPTTFQSWVEFANHKTGLTPENTVFWGRRLNFEHANTERLLL